MAPPPDKELVYEYSSRPTVVAGIILLFGILTALFGKLATAPQTGGTQDGFTVTPQGATAMLWVLCAVCALFLAMGVVLAIKRRVMRQRLVLGATGLTVPVSPWSRAEKTVAYKDISWLGVHKIHGQRMFSLQYPGGSVEIAASMLPAGDAYDTILNRLRAKATNLVR